MQFTKTGQRHSAITDSSTYMVRKSPVFTSQWEANRKTHREHSPWVTGPHTFGTLREAKEWCIEDHEAQAN